MFGVVVGLVVAVVVVIVWLVATLRHIDRLGAESERVVNRLTDCERSLHELQNRIGAAVFPRAKALAGLSGLPFALRYPTLVSRDDLDELAKALGCRWVQGEPAHWEHIPNERKEDHQPGGKS